MPRSKTRKNRNPSGGTGLDPGGRLPAASRRLYNMITAAAVVVVLIGAGTYWWWSATAERAFLALAAAGEASLSQVKTERSLGGGHLAAGATRTYTSRFPTSGSHHAVPTAPGFYTMSQQPIHLVHALEHGHIVVYYDRPDATVLETLKHWAGLYTGHWDGVVVTPMPGLGEKIVLTAWAKRLDQRRFGVPAAAAFIDAFRGRGPERPVR